MTDVGRQPQTRATPANAVDAVIDRYLLALAAGEETTDRPIEEQFVAVAGEFATTRRIEYGAWREVGVPPRVLKKAGIPPRASQQRRHS